MAYRVVILGANGFIGTALTAAILRTRDEPWTSTFF
jgi:nucleoside-diphosphate-sugar epimerase